MLQKINERELIKKCLSGDQGAWDELYKRYYNLVKKIVSFPRYGFSFNSYADHIQEIFLEIIKSLKNFKFDSKLSTFIVKIAQNKCVSVLRMQLSQKRPKNEISLNICRGEGPFAPTVQIADPNDGPPEIILKKEEKKRVKAALSHLKQECKKVLFLRFFMDKSYREIADELRLPLGTVCIQIRRCLLNLRKFYLIIND